MSTTSNISVTKEMLEKMVTKVKQINKNKEYLLVVNPLNTALTQKDLPENVELGFHECCPLDKGFLMEKEDYLRGVNLNEYGES